MPEVFFWPFRCLRPFRHVHDPCGSGPPEDTRGLRLDLRSRRRGDRRERGDLLPLKLPVGANPKENRAEGDDIDRAGVLRSRTGFLRGHALFPPQPAP